MSYNRPTHEKVPGDFRYAMLFIKKGNNKQFNNAEPLPADQSSVRLI